MTLFPPVVWGVISISSLIKIGYFLGRVRSR